MKNGNDMRVVTFGDWTYQAWLIAVKVWMLGRKHGVCRSHNGADFVGVDHGIGIYIGGLGSWSLSDGSFWIGNGWVQESCLLHKGKRSEMEE